MPNGVTLIVDKPKLTEKEVKWILTRVQSVKDSGYGKVIITIQQGKISYVETSVGEQAPLGI